MIVSEVRVEATSLCLGAGRYPLPMDLNPIERLWLHLRDNRLSHCVFQTTGEIVDTCCEAWNWLLGQTGRIRSLCSYPWLERVSN
jgi:hypothetical protein